MIDLFESAKKTVGGKYISVNDIIKKYPDGVTVNGIASRMGKDKKEYYTLTFAEDETAFFPASSGDLNKIVTFWLEKGSIDEINEALSVENIKIRIEKITQKNGNPYVKVLLLGKVPVKIFVDENGAKIDSETGEVLNDSDPQEKDSDFPF